MNETPKGNRIHIGIFGRRNAGKSSLINALTGQDMAIVSHAPGTTTDPVSKAMELHPIGPVVFIDTAGFDDDGELGDLRKKRTSQTTDKVDIAILVIDGASEDPLALERDWKRMLEDRRIPTLIVINKSDLITEVDEDQKIEVVREIVGEPVVVSATTGDGIDELRKALVEASRRISDEEEMLAADVEEGSLVLLVMPQDIQAPKGRLILPQVQTIRALLDSRCTVVSTTADGFARSLGELGREPDLIITDSQCFGQVYGEKPEKSRLTSFSILMAKAKGDMDVFIDGAKAIDDLIRRQTDPMAGSTDPVAGKLSARPPKILIAEACTHVPQNEDIGTVKIPRKLREIFGEDVEIVNVRGNDFPGIEELKGYDLIIHCGACMFNRRHVLSRIAAAKEAEVPMTNYGVFLAKMSGILDRVTF